MDSADILELLDRTDLNGVALEDAHRSVSYPDLGPSVRRFAGALAGYGVSTGDRVAVILPNSAAAVELYLASALLGAIWVGINPAAPRDERDRQVALTAPTVIVTSGTASSVPAGGGLVELPSMLADQTSSFGGPPPALDAPCAIGFSSGTTGVPKAIVHSRGGISLAAAALSDVNLRTGDRVGVVLPMSIHNLMVVGAMATLFAGATCVPAEQMNAAGVAAACRDRQLTMVSAFVPTTIYDLVHDDTIASGSLASVRAAGTGGAGLSGELRRAFEAKFGVPLVGSYGMTEAPGPVAIERIGIAHRPQGSGTPLPHLAVSTCDERGRPLRDGQQGELVVGPTATGPWAGRYRPAIGTWTEQGLTRGPLHDRSFRTGDYGWVDDDGTVHVNGRQADVIVRGGVNVKAAEIESLVGQIFGVRDVVVVGEFDDRLGQRIIAFVETLPRVAVDAVQLRERVRAVLSHGKVPDEFIVGV